jgi:hypothetical protein
VAALTINRLGEREIAAMIDRLTGNKLLPVTGHYRAYGRHPLVLPFRLRLWQCQRAYTHR